MNQCSKWASCQSCNVGDREGLRQECVKLEGNCYLCGSAFGRPRAINKCIGTALWQQVLFLWAWSKRTALLHLADQLSVHWSFPSGDLEVDSLGHLDDNKSTSIEVLPPTGDQ